MDFLTNTAISVTDDNHERGWQVILVTILCSVIAQTIKIVSKANPHWSTWIYAFFLKLVVCPPVTVVAQ